MRLIKTITSLIILIIFLASCVQEKHTKTITFKVDMRGIETIENVGVRGQFTTPSWEETIYLTDKDNDSIYETTITREAAQFGYKFKFVNQDSIFELENGNNRVVTFKYMPENIVYEAVFNNPKSKQSKK